MEIDPRFKAARESAQKRKRSTWLKPLLIWGGLAFGLTGAGLGLYLSGLVTIGDPGIEATGDLAITESDMQDNAAAYSSAFADIAGDPMMLRFDTGGGAEKTKTMIRPFEIPSSRAGNDLVLLSDDMITTEERLITTLPSSREDFAFFQAQRKAPMAMQPKPVIAVPEDNPAPVETVVVDEGEGSWGDNIEGVSEGGKADTYTKTRIEDTTSLAFLLPEKQRTPQYQDTFLRLKEPQDLAKLMIGKGMDEAAVTRFVDAAKVLVPELGTLGPGHILAMRAARQGAISVPVQISLYTKDSYGGSLAVNDAGEVVLSADPWVEEDLFSYAGDDAVADADIGRKYRLLDAFYSAAIRNRVPSAVVAEAIVLLSQSYDMESFAAPGDKMTLLYSPDPGTDGAGPGQVLYAAIKGDGRDLQCAVFKPNGKEEYSCFGKGSKGGGGGGGGTTLRSGLVTPTQGVLTSRFGPRMHPILKVAKLHKGTDWAAPIGTPVVAAFAGTILLAGDGGTYGNLVKISHAGNLETRYAHLSAFAPGLKAGQQVNAGDLIGYIGTTGQSTGPHLHFELYENGVAVDPLAGDTAVMADSGDGSAVEILVDQIIRVESGGKADAANPLSTAVGLGQFIESTWLRMMKQYRPDLAGSMTRDELLALRTDPTLSREMVTALAREGEAYLRARGHQITAGRLYLCHFLGAEGANIALSSDDGAFVIDAMGAGVVNANPFLKGKTIADLKQWAENKMNHKGGGALPVAVIIPPEVLAYQKVIDTLVGAPT